MSTPEDRGTAGVTLLMPVLNEIDGLRAIVPTIDRSLFDEVLIVDGGSDDGSLAFAEANCIKVIRQQRSGLGFGVFDALDEIYSEFVIEFSPDGNCLVEQIPALVDKLKEGYDLVVVSRYLDGAKSYDDTRVTWFGNFVFTWLINNLNKSTITDALNIYRGFRKSLAKQEDFERCLFGPVFEPLLSAIAGVQNKRVAEISGDEPKRIGGEQKMQVVYNGLCVLLMVGRMYLYKLGIKL